MEIKRGKTVIADVYLRNNSYTVEEIMGEFTLTLNFLYRNVVDLQINDYVDFDGNTYKIRHNEKVTKRETSLGYEYTVVLYSGKYDLQDVQFFLHGKPERKRNLDHYTGTARDWLNLFVKNMNRKGSGWVAGSCIESRTITLSFKDKKVGSVLDELIKELGTEYWISGKTISIGKREYASDGLVLGQGEGMGFADLEVSAVDDTPPITVLYPYGSDKNLGPDYGSDYLLLPGGVLSLEKNVDKYGRIEQSKQFDHIFPKGEFAVTGKIDDRTLKSNIDFNLTDCLLDGVEVIVTFQDGGLAGYDLAIVEGSWDNTLSQFKLKVNEQENALKVPGDINFSVGDRFILTGLRMPQSYIAKASLRLQEEAQAYLDGKCEKRIQLRGKCDEVFFRLQNLFITCGQMVGVYSEQLKIDREIRVTRVKRFIENDNKPCYRYELTLSDFLRDNGFKDLVDDVNKVPEDIEDKVKPVREYSKRSWRAMLETGKMLEKAIEGFTASINPITVSTMQVRVGSEQLQYRYVNGKTAPREYIPDFVMDDVAKVFKAPAGTIQHMTLGIDSISVSHAVSEYSFWDIAAYTSPFLGGDKPAYYLYLKCDKGGLSGTYLLDREPHPKMDPGDGHYYFLVGTLGSEFEGERSFEAVYGFTEILPGRMTIGLVKSADGETYFNLTEGVIAGNIHIRAGSTGYENLGDKPDLGIYATHSDLSVLDDRITGAVTAIDDLGREIMSSGFLVEADRTMIYATLRGEIQSSISVGINGIDLDGYVKFTNLKETADGAMQSETYIDGGKIRTQYLDVDSIFARQASIGGFSIDGTELVNHNGNAGISIIYDGYRYVRINARGGNGVLDIRNDGGYGVYVQAYDGGTGLRAIGNTGAVAMDVIGPTRFTIRGGEDIRMAGIMDVATNTEYYGKVCVFNDGEHNLLVLKGI